MYQPNRSSKKGTKASEQLYRQTVDMERKLGQLKNRMEAENEQRRILESKKSETGSYWRSGNSKLGGVRTYQKDVKARQAAVKPRPKQKGGPSPAAKNFTTKSVKDWVMADTLSWLTSLDLYAYGQKFAENEIFGDILLDLGLDDLDYMGIKVLAHRKKLLKGIEELKRNGKGSTNAPPPPPENSGLNVGSEAKEPEPAERKHWSEVKPISENFVKEPVGGDVYDEAAEAAAFKAAVAEWRNGGTAQSGPGKANSGDKVVTIKSGPAKPAFSFASIADDNGSSSGWSNPFAYSADNESKTNESSPATGGALFNGEYDEAAEAAAFKRAVDEWRNPGAAKAARAAKKSNNDQDSEEGTGTDYDDLTKSSQVAQSLAEKMEADFAKKKEELVARRKAAEIAMKERMAQKEKELNEMYANKENELGDLEGWSAEEKDDGRGEGEGEEVFEVKGGEEKGVEPLTVDVLHLSPSKDVGVEVLETEVYSPDAKEDGGYVVEVDSSDDEEVK